MCKMRVRLMTSKSSPVVLAEGIFDLIVLGGHRLPLAGFNRGRFFQRTRHRDKVALCTEQPVRGDMLIPQVIEIHAANGFQRMIRPSERREVNLTSVGKSRRFKGLFAGDGASVAYYTLLVYPNVDGDQRSPLVGRVCGPSQGAMGQFRPARRLE